MIYRNGKLITEVHQNIRQLIDQVSQLTEQSIGAIYKGSQLVWVTIYNAVKSCFGSGTWLQDKPWLDNDFWKIIKTNGNLEFK